MASGWRRLSSRYWRRIGERPTSSMPGNVSVPSSTRFFMELWPRADGRWRRTELGNHGRGVGDLIESQVGSPEHQRTYHDHGKEQRGVDNHVIGCRLAGSDAGSVV